MADEKTNPGVRYERKDIRLRWLLLLLAGGVCFAVTHYFVTWQFFWWHERRQEAAGQSPYPAAPGLSTQLPPPPRLEQLDHMATGETDISKSLAAKEQLLNSYGPAAEAGFVHIPIQEAIKKNAGKLPVRKPAGPSPKDNGLMDSGESNSGRMFRGERR